jgi:predicted alpha/beta hydrolase family esterase
MIITMPGIGGSDDAHWQSRWERSSSSIQRFAPASWDEPDVEDWSAALERAVSDAEPTILVAHSLSCLLAVRWSVANPGRVAGLFLVAASDPNGPNFPSQGADFADGLTVRPMVPSLLVTSDDDPYCSKAKASAIAASWRIPSISVGRRGHVNSDSGLGTWPEGRRLLTAFSAGLGISVGSALS